MNDTTSSSCASASLTTCSSGFAASTANEEQKPRRNSLNSHIDDRIAKRQRRMALSVSVDDNDDPDSPKNLMARLCLVNKTIQLEDKTKRLLQLLGRHPLFLQLSSDCLRRVLNEFVLNEYSRGDVIFRRDQFDDKFYVVDEGFCCIEGDENQLQSGIGVCFGDVSLVHPSLKKVTLIALCDASLWSIDGGLFRFLVSAHQLQQFELLKSFMRTYSKQLHLHLPSDLSYVVDASTVLEFNTGDVITSPNHPSLGQHDTVFFVKEGTVELSTVMDPKIYPNAVAQSRVCHAVTAFGELVLDPTFMPSTYTARCTSATCIIVATKSVIFQRLPYLRSLLSRFQA